MKYENPPTGKVQDSKSQNPKNMGFSDNNTSCQICGKRGHVALKCWHRFNQAYCHDDIPEALAAITIRDSQDEEWFPDTGASTHMTGDPGKLVNLYAYNGNDSVMIGDGNTLKITHTGDAILQTKTSHFQIKNVLLVPELKKNLLSVSQFTNDYPCDFEFSAGGFVVKDRATKTVIMEGTTKGDLYALGAPKWEAFFSNRNRLA